MKTTTLTKEERDFKKADGDLRAAVALYSAISADDRKALRRVKKSAFAFWKVIMKMYSYDPDFLHAWD